MQILKFKKTDPKAIIPRRQTEGAAGFDLHALEAEYLHKTTTPLMVRTGISVEIPPGHVGLIRDRSGLAAKTALSQFYHASKELIDSGGSPEACRKFDDAEAKVLAIIGIVEQDTKTREDHPK